MIPVTRPVIAIPLPACFGAIPLEARTIAIIPKITPPKPVQDKTREHIPKTIEATDFECCSAIYFNYIQHL